MIAKDIMTKEVVTVGPRTPVRNLTKILSKNRISGAPVVDGRGKILGIVTEADLLGKKGSQVKSIMNKRLIKVREDATVEEIASLLASHKINRVPVVRGEKLAGIVSRADIVRAMALGDHVAIRTPVYDL